MVTPRGPGSAPGQDRVTSVVLAIAAFWSAGLVVAAALAPAYRSTSVSSSSVGNLNGATTTMSQHTTSATMVQENGLRVLAVLAIPLLAVAVVALLLRRRRIRTRPGAGIVAWTVTAVLAAFCFLAMLTVGVFVLPVPVLLLAACGRAPRPDLSAAWDATS